MAQIPKKKTSKLQKWIKYIASNKLLCFSVIFAVLLTVVPYFSPSLSISSVYRFIEHLKWAYLTSAKTPPPLRSDISLSANVVSKIKWNHSLPAHDVIRGVVENGKPVLIRNGPATFWPIANWDILDFLKAGNDIVMEGVRWQREPVFVLGREREKGGMLGSPRDRPLLYINSTMTAFLRTVFNTSQFMYWSGELASLEDVTEFLATKPLPSSLSPDGSDVSGLDWRAFKHIDSGLRNSIDVDDDELWVPMVWLSHPGVVAQTHFDPQHNFLSQLQGRKRVILFPPTEQSMHLYPHIHRSYRQSQLHLEKGAHDAQLFPSLPTSGMEVLLRPGDSLYIPPYWHHRVESLTMALSVSVTSPAHLEAVFSEISYQTVPFGKFTSEQGGRQVAVKLYLGLLFNAMRPGQVLGKMDLQDFSAYLYSSRYQALFPPDTLRRTRGTFSCPGFPAEGSALEMAVQNSSAAFQQTANKVSIMLRDVRAGLQLKREFMGDYVEELVRWGVGPANTVFFIHDCLK